MESFYQERQLFFSPPLSGWWPWWGGVLDKNRIGDNTIETDNSWWVLLQRAPRTQRGIKFGDFGLEPNRKGGGKDRYLISVVTCLYRVVHMVVEKVLSKVSVMFRLLIPFKIDTWQTVTDSVRPQGWQRLRWDRSMAPQDLIYYTILSD